MSTRAPHPPESEVSRGVRLQKFLARAGVASRRAAEDLIAAGRVSVGGRIVSELGSRVDPAVDVVCVDGVRVRPVEGDVTLMLCKPAGVVTTMSDPQGRPTVADLVPTGEYPSLFAVGRLDMDTTGLLLFTTDGELGQRLLHPSHHVAKTYLARVSGTPSDAELGRLRAGIVLDDGPCQPADVERAGEDALPCRAASASEGWGEGWGRSGAVVRITISEGRKRQVKRMFSAIGHPVVALHREAFGPLRLGSLEPGRWRFLEPTEETSLRRAAGLGE